MTRKKKKSNAGGARPGAGAKKQWNEATASIAFRWPVSFVNQVKELPEPNKTVYTILKPHIDNESSISDNKA